MTPAAKRRWFRFSVRTLLVLVGLVALLLGWIGFELNWIRERRAAIESGEVGVIISASLWIPHSPHPPPWHLRLFGAQEIWGFGLLTAPDATDAELNRMRRLFPEFTVERSLPPGHVDIDP